MNQLLEKLQFPALLIVRIVSGYMFMLHGLAKFFEYPMSMTGGNGAVPIFSIYGIGGLIEIAGGVLIILGLFTRFSAFILAGQMAYAYWIMHAAKAGIWLQPMQNGNGGELAAIYSVLFLTLVFTGAGKLSLDHKLFNKA